MASSIFKKIFVRSSHFANKIKNSGVHLGMDRMKILELQVINSFAMVFFVFSVIELSSMPWSGYFFLIPPVLFISFGLLSSLILNQMRRYRAARWMLLVSFNIGLTRMAMLFGSDHNITMSFMFSMLIAVRSFTERREHLLALAFNLVCWFVVLYFQHVATWGNLEVWNHPKDLYDMLWHSLTLAVIYLSSVVYRGQLVDCHRREQATVERRQILLAMLSHDVAQPLTIANTLAADLVHKSPPEMKATTTELNESLESASDLLDRVRQFLRALDSADRMAIQMVEASDILEWVLRQYKTPAKEKDVRFKIESEAIPVVLETDPLLLVHSLIGNLVLNALNFSPKGGTIVFKWWVVDDDWCLQIIDEGPALKFDWEKGQRHEDSSIPNSKNYLERGNGIGLFIAKSVVQKWKGSIRATSSEGQIRGACFEIRLPISSPLFDS
jgi:signal transduction histidine kinase